MSLGRTLVTFFVSKKTKAAMEAESRQWMMVCRCGAESSVWDRGGIRYKAAGSPKRRAPCDACGEKTWHTLVKREAGNVER
jgi:hypothetical protein